MTVNKYDCKHNYLYSETLKPTKLKMRISLLKMTTESCKNDATTLSRMNFSGH